MSKKSNDVERLQVYLTAEQTKKLRKYIVGVVKKMGKVPARLKQKIIRMALEEWFENHMEDFDIDWDHMG